MKESVFHLVALLPRTYPNEHPALAEVRRATFVPGLEGMRVVVDIPGECKVVTLMLGTRDLIHAMLDADIPIATELALALTRRKPTTE
jgi:hypothetical protein